MVPVEPWCHPLDDRHAMNTRDLIGHQANLMCNSYFTGVLMTNHQISIDDDVTILQRMTPWLHGNHDTTCPDLNETYGQNKLQGHY